nr:MAG TPA: hypothetical protein [Caudoviricetes sp.]
MTIKQTGGTVVGAVVQNLPIVIDGRQSIYEEGLKNGTLPEGMTYKQFLDMLSVGVSDDEVKKIVAATVSAELIRLGLANQAGTGNGAAVTPTPAPTQPGTGGTGNNAAVTPTPAPTQPSTDNSGVSNDALADILKDLGETNG